MTTKHKNAIRRGIKKMFVRRRRSLAMIESWKRRRDAGASSNNSTPKVCHTPEDKIARIEALARLWRVLQTERDEHIHPDSDHIIDHAITRVRLDIITIAKGLK